MSTERYITFQKFIPPVDKRTPSTSQTLVSPHTWSKWYFRVCHKRNRTLTTSFLFRKPNNRAFLRDSTGNEINRRPRQGPAYGACAPTYHCRQLPDVPPRQTALACI